ncbi:helix-turn-helix domain-containing protein [Paenibacillus thermotolerans]|uniref:helix-turn-helix domain-containing protein n=1 Tax=Paenibacillus thermotolerans TaxID=3027807 RepID=UPI00236843EF|nr:MULTISPECIES: LexA family transcriptional regulator [unclassified Paenibacillus]
MKIGKRLSELRSKKHITQDEMAEILGVKRPRYNAWENNISSPDIEYLVKLAEFHNVTLDFLLGKSDDSSPVSLQLQLIEDIEPNEKLAEKLKYLRLKNKKTIEEVVDDLRMNGYPFFINKFIYSGLEQGYIPNGYGSLLQSIADYFDVSLEYLNSDEEVPNLVDIEKLDDVLIPLVGTICAGDGLLASQNIEDYLRYPFPTKRQPDFALKVDGNSMINVGIESGDIVFMREAKWAEYNGQVVAAIINGEDGTLKRMKWTEGSPKIQLIPENEKFQTIEVWPNEVQICGVYMGHFKPERHI